VVTGRTLYKPLSNYGERKRKKKGLMLMERQRNQIGSVSIEIFCK
jgi:hypothetical protein